MSDKRAIAMAKRVLMRRALADQMPFGSYLPVKRAGVLVGGKKRKRRAGVLLGKRTGAVHMGGVLLGRQTGATAMGGVRRKRQVKRAGVGAAGYRHPMKQGLRRGRKMNPRAGIVQPYYAWGPNGVCHFYSAHHPASREKAKAAAMAGHGAAKSRRLRRKKLAAHRN